MPIVGVSLGFLPAEMGGSRFLGNPESWATAQPGFRAYEPCTLACTLAKDTLIHRKGEYLLLTPSSFRKQTLGLSFLGAWEPALGGDRLAQTKDSDRTRTTEWTRGLCSHAQPLTPLQAKREGKGIAEGSRRPTLMDTLGNDARTSCEASSIQYLFEGNSRRNGTPLQLLTQYFLGSLALF